MPEADAEQRHTAFEKVLAELDRVGQSRGIAGAVGEDDTVRVVAQHVLDARVLTHHDHVGAAAAERAHLVQLHAVVDNHHARPAPGILAPGEHHTPVQRHVERLGVRAPGFVD